MSEDSTKPIGTLTVSGEPGWSEGRHVADALTTPACNAAGVLQNWNRWRMQPTASIQDNREALQDRVEQVQRGDMKGVEEMLVSQAHALEAMFSELSRRAALNVMDYPLATERYVRLALKAQSQCRVTLQTLAEIKNPPIVYAKQFNLAQGAQQVNNGVAHAGGNKSVQDKLLEQNPSERMDIGAQGQAGGSDTPLETVGAVNRTEDHGG